MSSFQYSDSSDFICGVEKIETFNLPIENSIRNIIKIKKASKTNQIYPRKIEKIKKENK